MSKKQKNDNSETNTTLQVFIWGDNNNCINLIDKVKVNEPDVNYEIVGCCHDNTWLDGTVVQQDIPYIPIVDLVQKIRKNKNYILILCETNERINAIFQFLKNQGIHNIITADYLKSHFRTMRDTLNSLQKFNQNETALMVASPPKTGNMTVCKTLNDLNIPYIACEHQPHKAGHFKNYKKLKVITAVREPIIQNLSLMFQQISAPYPNYFNLTIKANYKDKKQFTSTIDNIYPLFDSFNYEQEKHWSMYYLDKYFIEFNKTVLNIFDSPFDTEKGYSIIKKGNIEVFVYQLEKMNDIIEEISNWIGDVSFNEWIRANEADAKWISDFYKKTKQDITFTQEYFENAYNHKWVQHFYSQEDIEKFKDNWRSHII